MRRTVLVVDDHAGFRASVRALLRHGPFEVVAEAEDGDSAMAAVAAHHPDVVLLDVTLPGPDGFTVAARLAAHPFPPAVVLISSRDLADYGVVLSDKQVRGFIQKAGLSVGAIEALVS